MKIILIGKSDYRLNCYPVRQKANGQIEYFLSGTGWKKTKNFKEIDGEFPELEDIPWLTIAELTDRFGLNVGESYANCKVAGIIARDFARAKCGLYQRCKNLLPQKGTIEYEKFEALFEFIPHDYLLGCFGISSLDVIKLDEKFAKIDPEYNAELSTYKDKPCSMRNYISIKYGEQITSIIEAMLKPNNQTE